MAEREGSPGDPPRERGSAAAAAGQRTVAELRDVNERLLIAGLREQELAVTLGAERARLAVILAGIGDAVLVVDEAGTPVHTNAAYARMAGGPDIPWRRRPRGRHGDWRRWWTT